MSIAILRASGEQFDVDKFLAATPAVRFQDVWHRGETRMQNHVLSEDGFTADIAETETTADLVAKVAEFLTRGAGLINRLESQGAVVVIDIGLFVGSPTSYVASVSFPPSVLRRLGELNVRLEVTAYPTSADE